MSNKYTVLADTPDFVPASESYVDDAIGALPSINTHGSGTLAALPASPVAGDSYRVTSGPSVDKVFYCFVDGDWNPLVKEGQAFDMDGTRIHGLDDPSADDDAATKGYVDTGDATTLAAAQAYADNALQGFVPKGSARVVLAQTSLATLLGGCTYDGGTKRLTASGNGALGTVDGVADLAVDDLVGVPLLTSTDAKYNGPWRIVSLGSVSTPVVLQRAANFDSSADIKASSYYLVEDGTEYGGSLYQLTTEGPYTLDTTALTWVRRRINLSLSDATPAALGTATPGTSGEASRRDHAHAMPSAADVGAVRTGSHVADASALPTPTADLLGAQYLLTGGVDGLGAPLLATCVTDDGVACSWGLVPFGADVAGLRDALDTYSTTEVDAADAATLAAAQAYADAVANGLDPKASVYAAELSVDLTLSGTQTVGGVSVGAGKRVLVGAQSTASQNGLYVTAAGAWSRAADAVTGTLSSGAHTFCEAGDNAGVEYLLTTADPITVGTTAQTWVFYRKMQLSLSAAQPLGSASAGATGQASDAGHVHAMPSAADVGAVALSILTTRGAMIRRGASAPEEVALGAAGTRLTSDGTDPGWQSPDVVCTTAELASTYAASDVLRGLIAYASDTGVTWVCRRTGVSTYAWVVLSYSTIAEPTTQPLLRWKLDEASGTTFANSGSASSADLTLAGSAFIPGEAVDFPYGMRCVATVNNWLTGAASVAPAYPITVRAWVRLFAFTTYCKVLFKPYNAASWSSPEGLGLTFGTTTNELSGYVVVSGSRKTVTVSSASRYMRLGEWSLLAMTYDGTTMELSRNGRVIGTTSQSGAIDYGGGTAQPWMVGGNSRVAGGGEQMDGCVAEACVDGYKVPLATLRQWYLRGVRRYT